MQSINNLYHACIYQEVNKKEVQMMWSPFFHIQQSKATEN